MRRKLVSLCFMCMSALVVSACGGGGSGGGAGTNNVGGSPPAPAPPPPASPPPPAPPPPASPPPPPPPPPTGQLTSIPDIPFDTEQEVGAATTTGALPASLGAGEVLALTTHNQADTPLNFSCSGTEESPAIISGGTVQGSGSVMEITGSWCLFDGTVFNNIRVQPAGDHMIFRNVEITEQQDKNGMNIGGTNIVIMDSEVHHNQGDDRHGIQVGAGADSVWILRNHIHHNGGDGFQACHDSNPSDDQGCATFPPKNIYIGNNVFNSDRENGVDFKYIENVVVEGNILHSFLPNSPGEEFCFDDDSFCGTYSSGSDGTALIVGSDGAPTNVVIVNNEFYGATNAVRLEEGVLTTIIDNNMHDLTGRCLQLDKEGFDTIFSGNTCKDTPRGIFQNWRVDFSLTVEDNVFENITDPTIEYETRQVCDDSTLVNNTFTNSGEVICGNTIAITADEINALPGASGNVVN